MPAQRGKPRYNRSKIRRNLTTWKVPTGSFLVPLFWGTRAKYCCRMLQESSSLQSFLVKTNMVGPWLVTSKAAVFKAHLQWLVVGDQDIQPDTDQSALQILLSVPVLRGKINSSRTRFFQMVSACPPHVELLAPHK